jgi:hypothetical protein
MTLHPDRDAGQDLRRVCRKWARRGDRANGSYLFTGYLVAEAGRIKLLRESFNPLTIVEAQLPNGVADIGPPGDQVHSFRSSARRVQIRQCGLGRQTVCSSYQLTFVLSANSKE